MKITFTNNNISNLFKKIPQQQQLAETKKDMKQEAHCLAYGLSAGLLSGAIITCIMKYKKQPHKFSNALSVGSAVAIFTYLGTLLYSTIQNIKNNKA